jgi:undecaprenyl diphosphate synthase
MSKNKPTAVTPTHLGVIMDGNRRWAKAAGLKSVEGHFRGYKNLRDLAIYALVEKKVPYVSAFVFSTENWSRTEEEVGYLMNLVLRALTEYLDEFHQKNIRILVLGQRDKLSDKVVEAIKTAEAKTKDNSGGTLALCFNYGGQAEIVDAARSLIEQKVSAAEVSIETIAGALYHPEVPPLDLIVRTSGEQRLSGFMLWRAAYSELYFVDKHWPDFTTADIDAALDEFAKRQRRFGQ